MEEMLIDSACGRKFRYKDNDYLRISGIWFKWIINNYTGEGQYKVIKENDILENAYQTLQVIK